MKKSNLNILLADDHKILRQGLKKILDESFRDTHYGEAANSDDVMRILDESKWDIAILDLNMPGKSGLEILKDLKALRPEIPVLVLSMYPEEQFALRVIKSGAAGYLTKDSAPEELVSAVEKILEGKKFITQSLAELLASEIKKPGVEYSHQLLSDREYEIFLMIAGGKTVSQIADELSLSSKTVSTHRAHILQKTNLKNNADISLYAIRHKLVD
ncbi:MAG TPA: response regulator transcription factor [Ignavibacteriaceae bacterium]|nr:response regulator transcription factor [Ignavibacteriaceae bacterium]